MRVTGKSAQVVDYTIELSNREAETLNEALDYAQDYIANFGVRNPEMTSLIHFLRGELP